MPADEVRASSRLASRLGKAARGAVILTVGLFLALLVYGLINKAPNARIDESLAQAQAIEAPGLELPVLQQGALGPELGASLRPALADDRISLEELRGRPVVLNFWASWCVPCQEEAPLLERAWREARPDGVLFLGLNMQDLTQDAGDFIREFDNTYPMVRDKSNGVARDWGVTGLPETFFVSPSGDVVGHVIGVVSSEQLANGIAAARAGRPLGPIDGGARRPTR